MSRARITVVIVAAVLLAAIIYISRRSSSSLNVEPHAREEIEKAKRR